MNITSEDILNHQKAVADLAIIKKLELALRNKIISSFRFKKQEGTENREFEDTKLKAKLTISLNLNRKLDQEAIESLWSDFTIEQKEVLVKTHSLLLGDYKKLDDKGKLQMCITEKPGQASLKIEIDE